MVEFVLLTHGGQPVSIEYQWLNREREHTPLLVFLHEGLGSVSRSEERRVGKECRL